MKICNPIKQILNIFCWERKEKFSIYQHLQDYITHTREQAQLRLQHGKISLRSLETMVSSFTSFSSQVTLIAITTFFILSTLCSASSTTTKLQPHPFKRIYAFGDSFTDTGNTKSISGPNGFGHVSNPPYGSTFFHHPTNRYSDGRLVIDFVAQSLNLPFLPPYLNNKNASQGVNFAVAGSTAINHQFFVKNNLTLDLTPQSIQTQLLWFNKFLESLGCSATEIECKAAGFDDSLFWVGEIGVNDYAYIVGSSVPGDLIQKLAISSFTGFLQVKTLQHTFLLYYFHQQFA